MSIQFGKWNFDGNSVDPENLLSIRPTLAEEPGGGEGLHCEGEIGILQVSYGTTLSPHGENHPHVSPSGVVVTWDGRLDNREDLIRSLSSDLTRDSVDLAIVAAAYEKWKTDSFARMVGDWAISVWNPHERSLVLARDFIGVGQLFYRVEKHHMTWCTDLAPLVLSAGKSLHLDEEYVAGCLAFCPATHVTPYTEIRSVPPCSFVRLGKRFQRIAQYWDFDPEKTIRYRKDRDYEEHFRAIFRQSVRRRLRSNSPVTAELSGGLDSSSIVCVADDIIASGFPDTPRLDTLSYYDDSEPSWNERPYFSKVEQRRGRAGCHIDISAVPVLGEFDQAQLQVTPFSDGHSSETARKLAAFLKSSGCRVLISGFGGDEVAGGVPTPVPELADLVRYLRLRSLSHQLRAWALSRRQPWLKLLLETVRLFFPPPVSGNGRRSLPTPWIERDFLRKHRRAIAGYENRLTPFGPRPSFQENISTLNELRRQLGCFPRGSNPYYEKRYPYLDRDLLEFLFAIPRDQLVRPGQRRSLTRRALAGIVPDEVLNRRRKAFVCRAPIEALTREPIAPMLLGSSLRIVDQNSFRNCITAAVHGREIPVTAALRTVLLERWLRHTVERGIIQLAAPIDLSAIESANTACRSISNDLDTYQLGETSRERR